MPSSVSHPLTRPPSRPAGRDVAPESVVSAPTPPDRVVTNDAPSGDPPKVRSDELVPGVSLGPYRIEERLGEGAMGGVYRAYDSEFDRVVALKVLFPHIAKNPQLVERLYREGRALGQFDHANVLEAYGVGEIGGCHYLAMEYVKGENLQTLLKKVGRFSVGDALHLTIAIARGLGYAHGRGVVHRDVKPENVLVTADGSIKVCDFGMVKTGEEDLNLTQTGHALGTPWYMPLEQARNAKDVDGRGDVYALGCLFYCLLVGHPPFMGKTLLEVIEAKEHGTFPRARTVNIEVPEKLDLIIQKMTAKLPRHRYGDCDELIRDLESLCLTSSRLALHGPGDARPTPAKGTPTTPIATVVDLWHVYMQGSGGRTLVRQLTTNQVRRFLEIGHLTASSKATREPKTGFRALGTFKEFSTATSAAATRAASDRSQAKFRNLYREAAKVEQQRRRPDSNPQVESPTKIYWRTVVWDFAKYLVPLAIVGVIVWRISMLFVP